MLSGQNNGVTEVVLLPFVDLNEYGAVFAVRRVTSELELQRLFLFQ